MGGHNATFGDDRIGMIWKDEFENQRVCTTLREELGPWNATLYVLNSVLCFKFSLPILMEISRCLDVFDYENYD